MIPLYFEAHNFCQHGKARVDYQLGITGVVGDNGNGKSNLVDAAQYFAWTGDVPQDNKEDFLKWGETKGYTEVAFQVNGVVYYLKRNIHNASCDLKWTENDGTEKELTGQKKVNAAVIDFLGMPFEVFRETCFCPQTSLIEIINMPPAKRMEYFQKICGVQRAEVLRSVIQAKINDLPVFGDVTGRLNDFNILYARDTADLTTLHQELDAVKQRIPTGGVLSRMSEIQVALKKPDKQDNANKLRNAEVNIEHLIQTKAVLETKRPKPLPSSEDSDKMANLAQQCRNYCLIYDSLQHEKAALDLLESTTATPVKKPDDSMVKALDEMVREKRPLYMMAKNKVCPTCQRDFTFTDDPIDICITFENAEKLLKQMTADYNRDLSAYTMYESSATVYNTKKAMLLKSIETIQNKLSQFSEDVITFDLPTYDKAESLKAEHAQAVIVFERQLNQINNDLSAYTLVKQNLAGVDCLAAEERQALQNELAILQQLNDRYTQIDLKIAALTATVEANKKIISDLHVSQEKYIKVRDIKGKLEKARNVLHRDVLPRVVMSRILGSLNACLEFYLAKFNSGIVAKITDDFDFVASVNNGPVTSARRLSGGQKVALVVSFRFALSEVFARSIPLLVLDEPTAWLDTKRKEAMVDVLKLAKAFVEKGVYVFIMTHDPVLEPAMTRLIDV